MPGDGHFIAKEGGDHDAPGRVRGNGDAANDGAREHERAMAVREEEKWAIALYIA